MVDRTSELQQRLNPIIAANVTAAEKNLVGAVRQITDGAIAAGQYGSSRMALALVQVYRDELTDRGKLLWEAVMQTLDAFLPYQPMEMTQDLKHFIGDYLECSRVELAEDLRKRSGKQCEENAAFRERFQLRDLCTELLQSYGHLD